jgi:tetrahydromethanopterin S-methyltransferase subunit F
MQIGFIFAGMLFIHTGITPVLGGRDQRVIRGLRFGFAGLGIGFLVAGMVMLPAP